MGKYNDAIRCRAVALVIHEGMTLDKASKASKKAIGKHVPLGTIHSWVCNYRQRQVEMAMEASNA